MCCDGTIFDRVPVVESDRALPSLETFDLVKHGEALVFMQPCPAHCGSACMIYAERPQSCRNYRCRVLEQVLAGELGVAEAKALVTRARGAADQVAALLQPGENLTGARRMWREKRDFWRENPEFYLLMAALNLTLDKHFLHDGQQFMLTDHMPSAASE